MDGFLDCARDAPDIRSSCVDVSASGPHARTERRVDDESFWAFLRKNLLPLRPSQYDVTSVCNLTCEGCLFFSGDEYRDHGDETDAHEVERFYAGERARGVRYGYFGGAEPSLAEATLAAAARHIPYGVVFTNGTRRITADIPYRIHVSVWGRPERSRALRGASMLGKQARNYEGDARAVFVFTITAQNIGDLAWTAAFCADNGLKLTFNHYSPTSRYLSFVAGGGGQDAYHARRDDGVDLRLGPEELARAHGEVSELMARHGGVILYDREMNARMHDPEGLYPDLEAATGVARDCGVRLSASLRHHNTDLSRSAGKCCTPNIECSSCRLYAQSFATLLARGTRDLRNAEGRARLIRTWRLWCALFLNDDRIAPWSPESQA